MTTALVRGMRGGRFSGLLSRLLSGLFRGRRVASLVGLLAIGLISCEGRGPSAPVAPAIRFPARMQVTGGDVQSGPVGTELPAALTVRVLDAAGAVIAGQVVNFRIVSGNGTVFAGAAITDAQGRAAERWTLGTVAADSQRVEARAVNPATGAAIVFATFTATATVGAVTSMVRLTPDSQSVSPNGTVSSAPAVRTVDRFGNPVAGTRVLFRVTAGGGSLSDSVSVSDATGAARVAQWTAGPAVGPNVVTASSAGIPSVTFTATASNTATACTAGSALQLSVGQVVPLSAAQKASLCLGFAAFASEYVLIPFNASTVAASTSLLTLSAQGTVPSIAPPAMSAATRLTAAGAMRRLTSGVPSDGWSEIALRQRELRDLPRSFALARMQAGAGRTRSRNAQSGSTQSSRAQARLTNIPANPNVGDLFELNVNASGNLCSSPKQLRAVRVAAVLPNTLVFIDTLSPTGGFSDAELQAFGIAFDTLGYALDTLNFGAPTDIDSNKRVAILFTPAVNATPAPPGVVVRGYFTARDLFSTDPVNGCVASNEGELFYMPVPDPTRSINGNYASKSGVARSVSSTLVHEFQHLINAGRRIYVTNAPSLEEVWLNEGLSHIAEELLYYRVSGNTPRMNIGLDVLTSSQAQLDAANTYLAQNMLRLSTYLEAPESNSPFAINDLLETRGATWQLLRYAVDRKGGTDSDVWRALVSTRTSGQTNFNTVLGPITSIARDWAVAQFIDDIDLRVAPVYTNPSWSFQSVLPPLNDDLFPLKTYALLNAPIAIALNGGGAAYLHFRVPGASLATVTGTSLGGVVPNAVEFLLVRTQ